MADTKQIPGPENKSFMQRMVSRAAFKTIRTTISSIKPDDWMSALQPLAPWLPQVFGRQWDFSVGRNINYTPRGGEKVTFNTLRGFARNSEVVRLAIETRKDQLCAQKWQIKPRSDSDVAEDDPRIEKWTQFFKKPDGQNSWQDWYRSVLEEVFVTDALAIWRMPNRINGLQGLRQIDGATIFPLIDDSGYRPLPPDPAYQQILKGSPKGNYTTDELIYAPRNVRVYTPYGYSPVEQCLMSLKQDIARAESQLAYFTVGSVPDAYMTLPENMPADKIEAFGTYLNNLLAGNLGGKRQMPVAPFGTKIEQMKEQELKNTFDEWIARKICFAMSISPSAFIQQMNRATAETSKESALEEGQGPVMEWTAGLINRVLEEEGDGDLEFAYVNDKELDKKVETDIIVARKNAGIITTNEARDALGLDPVDEPSADELLVLTAGGLMPLPGSELDMEIKADQFDQQLQIAAAKPPAFGGNADGGSANGKDKPPEDKGNSDAPPANQKLLPGNGVRKAVRRHAPMPFRYASHARRAQKDGHRS